MLDLDGADRNHPLAQGRKESSVRSSLSTRSAVFLDLDGDGDLDLVTNEFDDVPQVLINDLSARRALHFLRGCSSSAPLPTVRDSAPPSGCMRVPER